jgi:multimeric flavodoxin WrbA
LPDNLKSCIQIIGNKKGGCVHRLIFVGSPRANGRSGALAEAIFDACIEDAPYDGVSVVSVAGMNIAGCIGCDGCKQSNNANISADQDAKQQNETKSQEARTGQQSQIDDQDPLAPCKIVTESDSSTHNCIFSDDMAEVRKHLDAADELIVVCPTYFAGPPSQAKAAMDRLQPYFWSNIRSRTKTRRPMTLHIIGEGEGGDPYGAQGLIACVRSAFGVSGFKLEKLLDWTGCITADGEIIAEAKEINIDTPSVRKYDPIVAETSGNTTKSTKNKDTAKKSKPKLDVHSANKRSATASQHNKPTRPSKNGKSSKKKATR